MRLCLKYWEIRFDLPAPAALETKGGRAKDMPIPTTKKTTKMATEKETAANAAEPNWPTMTLSTTLTEI